MIKVYCLNENLEYWFDAISGFEAMQKMLYYLNLKKIDRNATIKKYNTCLAIVHNNKTYACIDV